ncbi:hypothetical protein NEFER03_1681 [Nematocida sp. LUAm3]|nr:hypothetical protein NEFER03_1681 [Nematocida sp. LUAm3]KAI5175671.1 hypothetical protein NEFER02_1558 [Nematocida sp. LUAm2]KAI5178577.1 hypothetical protein NEFER01_1713 [Nematocida sp. LUAm1]
MEDKRQILVKYGIEEGVWSEGAGHIEEKEKEREIPENIDPRTKAFDPYDYIIDIIGDLSIDDLSNGQMAISNSLDKSIVKREELVRTHFSLYVKCRILLEEISHIKQEIDKTKAYDQNGVFSALNGILHPMIQENEEISRREAQMEFMNENRIIFDGPTLLEEHLSLNDIDAFVADYKKARSIYEKHSDSNFIGYLWSKFISVIGKFKAEISRKIEESEEISESLHFFNLYLQIDPESAQRAFGTILLVGKKEFHQEVESIRKQRIYLVSHPERSLLKFSSSLLTRFSFMLKSIEAIDLLYDQDKHKKDFLLSGADTFSNSLIQGIDILFEKYEKTSETQSASLIYTIGTVVESIKKFVKKIKIEEGDDIEEKEIDLPFHSAYSRLLSLLWSKAHTLSQDSLLDFTEKTEKIFSKKKDILKQVKKKIKEMVSCFSSLSPEKHLKSLLLLKQVTLPKIEKIVGDTEDTEEVNYLPDTTKEEIDSINAMGARLKLDLKKSVSDEHFLMIILKAKVLLTEVGVDCSSVFRQILVIALYEEKLTKNVKSQLKGILSQDILEGNKKQSKDQISARLEEVERKKSREKEDLHDPLKKQLVFLHEQ